VSDSTLKFPVEIKDEIGLNEKEINAMKAKGVRDALP
jgi:hypothetical protein